MQDPQFAGQTKERLFASVCGIRFGRGERCLHPVAEPKTFQSAELLAEMAISSAQRRMRAAKSGA